VNHAPGLADVALHTEGREGLPVVPGAGANDGNVRAGLSYLGYECLRVLPGYVSQSSITRPNLMGEWSSLRASSWLRAVKQGQPWVSNLPLTRFR
jgi:hypothetical protein